MRVLIAEDDPRLADVLSQALAEAGWRVDVHHDGAAAVNAALDAAADNTVLDVLVLDWNLPSMDGLKVCRRLRDLGLRTPVMMLTARCATRDKVAALDAGADDYLTKPFEVDELLARLRALRRRQKADHRAAVPLVAGGLTLDPGTHQVLRGQTSIELQAREFEVLQFLMAQAGRVVTRDNIVDVVWDRQRDVRPHVVDVYVAALRDKIDRPFGTATITTLRGVGYRLEVTPR